MECRLLFVYGSLKRGFELHHHLVRLGARFVAEARVAAVLRNWGRYPGARPAARARRGVRGELFDLRRATSALRVLDKVEGFSPAAAERSQFVRELTEVGLADGSRVRAWVYWLARRTQPWP